MLANFLAKSKPINFTVYLAFFLCFFLGTLFSTVLIGEFFWYKVFESISYFFIFQFIFLFYHLLVSKNSLTFDHSYAFFLFILGITLFIFKILDVKTLATLFVYLLFLRKIYSLQSEKNIIKKIFDSGFWLGILCILEPFSLLFSVLIFASILLHQKTSVNTLLTPLIGFISPLIIYFAYLFWNDSLEQFTQLFNLDLFNNVFFNTENYTNWVLGVFLLLTTCSLFAKSPKALSVNNSFKKNWLLLVINFIIAVTFVLLITKKNGSEMIFILVPSSIIIANGFEVIQKKLVKNILFALLIVGTIISFFLY